VLNPVCLQTYLEALMLWQLSIFGHFFFAGGIREVAYASDEVDVSSTDPFQLPSTGAALGIEVEIPRAKNAPLVQQYLKKGNDGSATVTYLPTRDGDCLAESAFFHLECDGSTYNRKTSVQSTINAAIKGYIGLMMDPEGQALIDGDWNGASTEKEEEGHWGSGCLIEIVGHPLTTDPQSVGVQLGMLTAVGHIQAAIEATLKGDKKSWTLDAMRTNYNKLLSQQKKNSGWKLTTPCQKHQRRIPRQDFSLKATPWAVPASLGKDEDALSQKKGYPLPMVFEGPGAPKPKVAQVTLGVPLATLGCPSVAPMYDLAQFGCTQHIAFRDDADKLAEAMGLDTPEEVGVVTLFLYFYENTKRKGTKHGIEFLFKSTAKDLVRQQGVLSEKGRRQLIWAAKDIKVRDVKDLDPMIETQARRVGRARTLRALLQKKDIGVDDWLNTFEPRKSNSDRYPDETDDVFGTSVLTKVRKSKSWMGHPHFAPSLAFTMNGQLAIAVESRDSQAQLNTDFSMYESVKSNGKDTRKTTIRAWLDTIHKVQAPPSCAGPVRQDTPGLDMVERLKAQIQDFRA